MSLDKLQKELAKEGINIKFANEIKKETKIRSGVFPLDYVLGGGLCLCEGGHRIEFWGAESTGKTTFALNIIAEYQRQGKTCVFVDAEESYDATWASMAGVNINELLVMKPTTLEQFGDIITTLVKEVDLIVVDSIITLIPEVMYDRNTNEPTMGIPAKLNALITNKLYSALSDQETTLIFINQMKNKLGVMYGSPETSGGGYALKHFYNTRIQFRLGKPIEEGKGDDKERVGYEVSLRNIKNKKGVPYRKAVVDLRIDGTIDNHKSLFHAGLKYGLIERAGAWFTYKDIRTQGKEKLMEELTDEDWKEIEDNVWEVLK